MPRKAEIKGMIQDELTKLAEADSDEEIERADNDNMAEASDKDGDSE